MFVGTSFSVCVTSVALEAAREAGVSVFNVNPEISTKLDQLSPRRRPWQNPANTKRDRSPLEV